MAWAATWLNIVPPAGFGLAAVQIVAIDVRPLQAPPSKLSMYRGQHIVSFKGDQIGWTYEPNFCISPRSRQSERYLGAILGHSAKACSL